MNRILFIGNFLSKQKGSIGPSEKLSVDLKLDYKILTASSFNFKLLRLVDFVFVSLFRIYDKVIIDVYSTFAIYFAIIVAYIAKLKKKIVILNLHGGGLMELYNTNPQLIKLFFNKADIIISPSMYLSSFFIEKRYNVLLLPNSLKIQMFPFKNNKYNYKILWIRGFKEIYNPYLAVDALELVLKNYPQSQLTMIGPDGGLLKDVEAYIKNKQLGNKISILGPIKNDRLVDFMHSHHVFINTTYYESFGMAVMEAAAAGIPIVSTQVGELPLIWDHGKEILLCQNNTAKEMSEHIEFLFSNADFSNSMREKARQKAEQYDWENIKIKWLKLLE